MKVRTEPTVEERIRYRRETPTTFALTHYVKRDQVSTATLNPWNVTRGAATTARNGAILIDFESLISTHERSDHCSLLIIADFSPYFVSKVEVNDDL